jgi:hypothetical protein
MLVAGIALFVVRPGTAFAHHAEIAVGGDCTAWTTKAEYIGGDEDRKVVVDVIINGEAIQETFFFDFDPGHLGHQDYWLLYERSGSGSLQTSGTITLYRRSGGAYSIVDNSTSVDEGFECEEAQGTVTPLPTDTPEPTSTNTPEPTATDTPVPTATNTPEPAATDTPQPTATNTVQASPTPTPTEPEPTNTPIATNTPPAQPTFISTVEAAAPPNRPPAEEPPSSRQTPPEEPEDGGSGFPRSGYGTQSPGSGLAAGIAGLMLAAGGMIVLGTGLRRRA